MAEPKKKLSKTRTNLRRSQYKIATKGFVLCKNCGESILPHLVCTKCGFYKGVAVVTNLPTKRISANDDNQ